MPQQSKHLEILLIMSFPFLSAIYLRSFRNLGVSNAAVDFIRNISEKDSKDLKYIMMKDKKLIITGICISFDCCSLL